MKIFNGCVWLASLAIALIINTPSAAAHPGHSGHFSTEQILNPEFTITGLALAFVFGAIHALTPGHGKTLVSTYLVGSNSTFRHALLLSMVTTTTHTASIFLLGLVVLFASNYLLPEQLYFVFSLLSGIAICCIGFWQIESYFNPVPKHHHQHDNSITLGIAGGLTPCSEALALLLGAIALHKTIYGIELVFAFSLGLALVLAIVGLLTIYSQQWLKEFPQFNLMQTYLPLVGAIFISLIGLIITIKAIV